MQKKFLTNMLVIVVVLAMLVPNQPASANAEYPQASKVSSNYVPGEVVVAFQPGKQLSDYTASASALAGEIGALPVQVTADGAALLRFDESADVEKLAAQLSAKADVRYAEPNYIYSLPPIASGIADGKEIQQDYVLRSLPEDQYPGMDGAAVPVANLQAMQSVVNGKVQATYPNDPYLWRNNGYSWVGADIVSSNKTYSATVCVLDTGVDYKHKDLSGRVLKGYDFVNGDSDPMDDFGHGTHVAGIIAAKSNNKEGMAGASTAKVVAVKVLDSQGFGTNFDIAAGINYCANRSDVKVLNLSLGGDESQMVYDAVYYAVNTKGKLVVAAAGNSSTDAPSFPAGLAAYPEFSNKVLAVAASGLIVDEYDDEDNYLGSYVNNSSLANYSNYGDWISVVAPGTWIYSTTPWDRVFYMNYYEGFETRYDYMSGTSMATPFVAAAAARRWGYKPLETNAQVGQAVCLSGNEIYANDDDWAAGYGYPSSMEGLHRIDIPTLLDRFAASAGVYDASTGLPLVGAQVRAYVGTSYKGSALIVPTSYKSTGYIPRTYMYFSAYTDIINLPRSSTGPLFDDAGYFNMYDDAYTYKVYKSGYTASSQPAFIHSWYAYSYNTVFLDRTAIPPKSSNFDVVLGFEQRNYDYLENPPDLDLDLNVWLPAAPNPLDPGQPAPFIVGPEGNSFGFVEGDPTGVMTAFPFARMKREGGWVDWLPFEDITISSRKAHSPLSTNSALPYYPGTYVIAVSGWDQTYDHDNDAGTPEIPVMGAYAFPYVYIWKDGYIKLYNELPYADPYDSTPDPCNRQWWKAASISSGISGSPTYSIYNNVCSNDPDILPYY